MPQRIELLRILADGRFYSGEALGRRLGVSRAAIWKQLNALRARGLDIHSVPGRGYRLAARIELLEAEAIRARLPETVRTRLTGLEIHPEIDSTNDELLRRAAELTAPYVCLAESQRAGRGRQLRGWYSPFARNVYLSLLWRFADGPDSLAGLSLAIGVGVLRVLRAAGVREAGLKWPNDIVWRGAKLAGVLVEMRAESCGPCTAVIGVGLNVDMPETAEQAIDQAWSDVHTAAGRAVSRNLLAALLVEHLVEVLDAYAAEGLDAFVREWRRYDAFLGQRVQIRTGLGVTTSGIERGIDGTGALLLETGGGVRRFLSGDVSLRAGDARAPAVPALRESEA